MTSPKLDESQVLTDQELIREIFPHSAPKRIARLMRVPLETARHWCYRHLSNARRQELAVKLLQELDAKDRRRDAIRRQLELIIGERNEVGNQVAVLLDGLGTGEDESRPIGSLVRKESDLT